MTEPIVSVCGLSKRFGGVQALRDVSLDIWPGSVHCLVGENGCGKSTLVKMVSGVERPDAGSIAISGVSHAGLTPRQAVAAGVEVIYQDLSLFANLTVAENIAVAPLLAERRHRYSTAEAERLAAAAVQQLGVSLDLRATVADLPVSARQLVAICRALTDRARVIFMDEPTTSLTWREVQALFVVINRLVEHGVAVVFVSHKFNEILEIAESITVMRNGEVVAAGPVSAFDRARLSRTMTGHEIGGIKRAERYDEAQKPAVELEQLSSDGAFTDVTCAIARGEVLGLTGLLGSGHVELGEALFGLRAVRSGKIRIGGATQRIESVNDALSLGIGYVPSDRLSQGLFLGQSISTNLAAASVDRLPRRYGMVSRARLAETAREMIAKLAIKAPSERTPVNQLSGGHQQRVLLGKWLLRDPQVLIVNGPTVGVDVGSKREILQILRDVADRGTTVLVLSDDVSELVEVCDRVLVMREGRLAAEMSGSTLNVDAIIPEIVAA